MKRREFIEMAGAGAAGAVLARAGAEPRPFLVKDVAAHLRSIVPVDEPSVDRLVVGDPAAPVAAIGTCWLPYRETCERAVRDGVNLLVVHEPAFYTHWDLDEKSPDLFGASPAGRKAYIEAVERKKAWILDNKLAVIRCHDVLDKVAGWGIPFAFGEALGFGAADVVRSRPYYNVYKVEPRPAAEVARAIAAKLAAFRQPGVAFYGDRDRVVATVGVNTVVAAAAGVAVAPDVGLGWIGNLHAANKSAAVQSETNFGLNLFINYPPQFVRSIYSTNYRKFCPSVEVSEWIMLCCYLLFGEAESADAALL